MEVKNVVMGVIILLVGGILLASMLPTALNAFYDVPSDETAFAYSGYDVNGKTIADDKNITNSAAVSSIFQLLPLFTVLGGMAILAAFAYREYA